MKFTLRLKNTLYDKIKQYAEGNGLTIVGAIRFILNQFFANK